MFYQGLKKDVLVHNVLKKEFSMDDMRNIPCRIKSFKDLIIYHDRMTSNSNISINMFDRKCQKRYHRINYLMKIYNNCTDNNKLFMYSKYLIDARGSAFQYGIN